MKSSEIGFWSLIHLALDRIGRGAVKVLNRAVSPEEDEITYAMTGGALVSGILGAVVGVALSDRSHDINAIAGAVFGGVFGGCMGIIVGSTVAIVDDSIKRLINSLNSK